MTTSYHSLSILDVPSQEQVPQEHNHTGEIHKETQNLINKMHNLHERNNNAQLLFTLNGFMIIKIAPQFVTQQLITIANRRPMLPIVIPPEKKIHGSHDLMNRKSGAVYLEE